MNRSRIVTIALGLALYVGLGCDGEEKSQQVLQQPTPVRTAKVRVVENRFVVRASGTVAGKKEMRLGFKAGGIVGTVDVEEGDWVEKGARLAMLNQTEIRARLAQARSRFEKAEQDLADSEKLYADKAVSQEHRRSAKQVWEEARAELEIARHHLELATIFAPGRGRILKKLGEVHEVIEAGHPLFLFESAEQALVLRTTVADRDVVRLSLGDSASVAFYAYPRRPVPAILSQLPGGADPQTGLFEVELKLQDVEDVLPSGLLGRAKIFTRHVEWLPAVPVEALIDADVDRGYVYVLNDEHAHRRPVSLGAIVGDQVLVLRGLSGGETVVVDGAPYLRDRVEVKAVSPDAHRVSGR